MILNRLMGITHEQDANFHYLHVNGGENWHKLVEWSINNGIYGLENLALIPGCAGSAPFKISVLMALNLKMYVIMWRYLI